MTTPQNKSNDDWRKELTAEEYKVMRERSTEAPFSGKYWDDHSRGTYVCRGCGAELFSSATKFDSGTGWPSFEEPANRTNVELHPDDSQGMLRTEVLCKNCGAHLGHIFDDYTTSTGKRYCINSVCLELKKDE